MDFADVDGDVSDIDDDVGDDVGNVGDYVADVDGDVGDDNLTCSQHRSHKSSDQSQVHNNPIYLQCFKCYFRISNENPIYLQCFRFLNVLFMKIPNLNFLF